MKYLISFLIILGSLTKVFACDCPPIETYQQRIENIHHADIVVLAEPTSADENTNQSTFKVLETFKGKSFDKVITVDQNNCSLTRFENGIWLLYGEYIQDNHIDVSLCNASRSLNGKTFPSPPPPPFANSFDSLQFKINTLEYRIDELKGLLNDIELLRNQKAQSEHTEKPPQDNTLYYLLFAMISINLLLGIYIIKIKRIHSLI